MEGVRIVHLNSSVSNSPSNPQFSTFEEAFGDYSELFGKKARARRSKRKASRREDRAAKRTARRTARNENKAERVAMRDERKRNKSETRQTRRSDRKENRQQARIERRRQRKEARQSMRAEQQAARMQRRMERKAQKQARKDLEAEREREREDLAMESYEDQGYDDGYDDGGYDDGGYDDGGYDDGGYDDGGYDDGGYDDGGYEDDGYDDDYYDPSDPYDDANSYNPYANTEDSQSYGEYDTGGGGSYNDPYGDEAVYEDDGNFWQDDEFYGSGSGGDYYPMEGPSDDFDYDVDYGFDGSIDEVVETGPSSFDGPGKDGQFVNEMMDGEGMGEYATAGGGSYLNEIALKSLADFAKRIEWNKENLSKFNKSSSYLGFSGDKDGEKSKCQKREAELKEGVRAWVNFEGDSEYMGADGKYKRIPSKKAIMSRMKAASRAKIKARSKRPSFKAKMQKRIAMAKKKGMAKRPMMNKRPGRAMQTAMRRKKPNILVKGGTPSPQRMMGKRMPKGSATKVEMGLSPTIENQKITVPARSSFSNAEGGKKNIIKSVPWKEVGIGLAVAVAGIVIYKQVSKNKK